MPPKPAAVKPPAKPKPKPPPRGSRQAFVNELMWGTKHEPQIHYLMVRPIPVHFPYHQLPMTTDCSGYVIKCAQWSGCEDPSGYDFNGEGYTGSIIQHCDEIHQWHAVLPGDLFVYGPGTGQHVVGVVKLRPDGDFDTVSHGQERGPVVVRHSVEVAYHAAPVRAYRFIH